jgi:hypothetical protein
MAWFARISRAHIGGMSLDAKRPVDVAVVAEQVVLVLILALCSWASAQNDQAADYTRSSQPRLLNYQELVTLSQQETVDALLAAKLHTLPTTPFVNNEAFFSGTKPLRPDLKGIGPSLRLVEWNIERGLEFDEIKLAMTDKQGFLAKAHGDAARNKAKVKISAEELSAQIDALQSADVLVLNELDWDMKRTDYRSVVKEFADALKMNWAYGVEANVENEGERKELEDLFSVDKDRVLGLHGAAILSRYPLRDVKLVPFEYQAYDWYNGEKKYGSVEAGKRRGASLVFGEEIVREVRSGGAPT